MPPALPAVKGGNRRWCTCATPHGYSISGKLPPPTPPKDLHASDYRQARLKTQSDASAVAANLPKICSGNCLHRGRNKVWGFEYANIICRQEHVMDVSHIA